MTSTKQHNKWLAIGAGTLAGAAVSGIISGVFTVDDTGLLVVITAFFSSTVSVSIMQSRSQ